MNSKQPCVWVRALAVQDHRLCYRGGEALKLLNSKKTCRLVRALAIQDHTLRYRPTALPIDERWTGEVKALQDLLAPRFCHHAQKGSTYRLRLNSIQPAIGWGFLKQNTWPRRELKMTRLTKHILEEKTGKT